MLDVDDDEVPVGAPYYRPTAETDRTWTVLMIAVRRDQQRQCRGGALVRHVEDDLQRPTATAPVGGTLRSSRLYAHPKVLRKAGYHAEARVRDYYQADDDMVLACNDLATGKPNSVAQPETSVHPYQ